MDKKSFIAGVKASIAEILERSTNKWVSVLEPGASFGAILAKNGLSPVSYTHLDVYKRQDLMSAVYRRTDGVLLANVVGVGTFLVEKLVAFNVPLLATLADEGWLRTNPDGIQREYQARFSAQSKAYRREHGIQDPDEEEQPAAATHDNPMAALAAMLGRELGAKVGVRRIDVPARCV